MLILLHVLSQFQSRKLCRLIQEIQHIEAITGRVMRPVGTETPWDGHNCALECSAGLEIHFSCIVALWGYRVELNFFIASPIQCMSLFILDLVIYTFRLVFHLLIIHRNQLTYIYIFLTCLCYAAAEYDLIQSTKSITILLHVGTLLTIST